MLIRRSSLSSHHEEAKLNSTNLFSDLHRQLAKISRSTRGVVLLLCDLNAAKRVMSEAQRLKMTGGHFIWIWADTSSTAEFFQPNSVQSADDTKDQTKNNYNYEEFVRRKPFDQLEPSAQQKYYQQQVGGKRTQPNNTRYKSANGNANRFHHIIGLRKPGDDINSDGSIAADQSFIRNEKLAGRLNAGQPGAKQKRMSNQFSDSTIDPRSIESEFSLESDKMSSNLNIKNINSHEFNANYYDPYSRAQPGESVFEGDFDESTNDETGNYDYDKSNPFRHEADATSASTTSRHSVPDADSSKSTAEKSKANSRKSSSNSNLNHRNNGNDNKVDGIATAPLPQLFDGDDSDDLSLDSYSDASNDLKAKRADNFPSAFNISSHVFFHHFKDFPVGLLALRHIKMNVDRVFVRSAIRLFASAWSRAESDDDDPRVATSGGGGSGNWKNNWSSDNEYDYDEVNNNNRNKKLRNKASVNNRQRGSRKYKRDAPEGSAESISTLVNSSNKTSNSNSNPKNNLTYSQHVSGLHSHPSDDGNRSNNDTLNHAKNHSKRTKSALDRETARDPDVGGDINLQKRQNTYWSTTLRGRSQDKAKGVHGTPQYKGGCFGVPSRADIKRSEVFAR